MKEFFSYIFKSIIGNRKGIEWRYITPAEHRRWDNIMLNLKAGSLSLIICGGLFFVVSGGSATDKWTQEREDEDYAEFGIKPLSNEPEKIAPVEIQPAQIILPVLDTIISYDSLGNASYVIGTREQLDSFIRKTDDTTKTK